MHPLPQRLALSLATLGLGLILAALAALVLLHQRTAAINSQARELNVLLLALSDEIQRGLQGTEVGMHAMRLELSQGRLPTSGAEAQRALHIRAELMPLVKRLWLIDAGGRVLAASDNMPSPALTAFSPPPEQLGMDAVAISRPFEDKTGQEPLVTLCVRFSASAGGPDGWMLAAIPANALRGAFSVAAQAPDARMAVFRNDGVRLSGAMVAAQPLDKNARRRLATAQSIELRQFQDGSERLVGLHTLPRYDLKLMLTRDVDAVLGPWREFAKIATIGLALMLAMMAIAVYLVLRANWRHAEAEHALQVTQSRASRLASLGTLAGGVAHDFNNVLAAILGYGEMAHDSAPKGSDQRRYLDHVLQATHRGKALVERILAFSRGGARASAVFELAPVVEQVLTLLAASLPPGVVLECGLDAPGARLRGDSTQVFEAVMNLCTNAIQAMPEGGMLGVRLTRQRETVPRLLSHAQLAAGEYLVLSVADQGAGITPEVMERLFEPFFTTRGTQAGTGLGLAVVHGIMAELDGAIDVQSTPGHGARFSLYFPECADALDPAASVQPLAPRGTGQTILVVDDEGPLVALLAELLSGLGYRTVGFTDPSAALQALRETPQHFAAVITDEVMPGLSGTQLIQTLRVFAPHLPVLLISGYGGAALAARAAAAGATRVLAKPLQRTDLANALAEAMH